MKGDQLTQKASAIPSGSRKKMMANAMLETSMH